MPRCLFDYADFATAYKGVSTEEASEGLDADTNLVRLPQVFHTASGVSLSSALRHFGEEVRSVAHAFSAGVYTNQNEIVWLRQVESKLEANTALVEKWLDQLEGVASNRVSLNANLADSQ